MSYCLSICDADGNCGEPLCIDSASASASAGASAGAGYPSGDSTPDSDCFNWGYMDYPNGSISELPGYINAAICSGKGKKQDYIDGAKKAMLEERGPSMAAMKKALESHVPRPTKQQYERLEDVSDYKILHRGSAKKGMYIAGTFVPNGSVLISLSGFGNRNDRHLVYSYHVVAEEKWTCVVSHVRAGY